MAGIEGAAAGGYSAGEKLPLPAEGLGSLDYWREQLKSSEEKLADYKSEWDRNVQSYLGKTLDKAPDRDTVVVPSDFSNVEQKKANLFFQTPDVQLTARMPGLEDAVGIFQAVINQKLSTDGVDALSMMHECLFDALCPAGMLVSVIGYESFEDGTVPIEVGQREVAPEQMPPGAVLGLGATVPAQTEPIMQEAPNVIHERYFWQRVSPARIRIPADFKGGSFDRAPWLGYAIDDDWEVLKRRFKLPEDLEVPRKVLEDDTRLKSEKSTSARTSERVTGTVIWYRAYCYDPNVPHPEAFRLLVLIDGIEEPVRHEDSPYQRLNAQGKLTGLMGNPIHIGALRYVSDTAYAPSEVSIARPLGDERNRSRTQMLNQRDRNIPMRIADLGRIGGEEGLSKIRKGAWQGVIGLPAASENDPPIFEVSEARFPNENFVFDQIIARDEQSVWAMGANQKGEANDEHKTATEVETIQQNVSARLDYERRLALDYFIRGVRKLAALVQLFADDTDYVEVVGPDGVRRLQPWNKDMVQGEFAFSAKPDSAIRVDAQQDRNMWLKSYELLARDPHVNRVELLTAGARKFNLDPQRLIVPQLPPKGPEPPNVSFRFAGQDLDPRLPHFPIVIAVMKQAGYQIPDEIIAQAEMHAQAQGQIMNELAAGAVPNMGTAGSTSGQGAKPDAGHPGPAFKAERLNKRTAGE